MVTEVRVDTFTRFALCWNWCSSSPYGHNQAEKAFGFSSTARASSYLKLSRGIPPQWRQAAGINNFYAPLSKIPTTILGTREVCHGSFYQENLQQGIQPIDSLQQSTRALTMRSRLTRCPQPETKQCGPLEPAYCCLTELLKWATSALGLPLCSLDFSRSQALARFFPPNPTFPFFFHRRQT